MHISFSPEKLIEIKGVPITNSLVMAWLAMAVLIGLALLVSRKPKLIPGKLQNLAEAILDGLLSFMTTITGDKEKTKKFFPFVTTLFAFILASNWMGILPGVGSIGFFEGHGEEEVFVPLFRSTNSDLNMTLALGLISVLSIQIFGVATLGFFSHLSKFISFKSPISFFFGILESVAEVSKVISFSFRLFGNIFAGEVLLMVIFFLLPLIAPLPFLFLEVFVGFIQALVFSMLTLVFLTVATSESHH